MKKHNIMPEEKIKLSIIMPAYNVERYVRDSLISVCKQLPDYAELIIINDGSTDNTEQRILETIASYQWKNISYILQDNHGIAFTRNEGVERARGEYITFIDSDDFWSDDYIDVMSTPLQEGYDIIEYGVNRFIIDKDEIVTTVKIHHLNLPGDNKLERIFRLSRWFTFSRAYKKELWNNIKFPTGRRYEDIAIIPVIYMKANSIKTLENALIYYRDNPASIVNNVNDSDINDIIHAINHVREYFAKHHSENMHLCSLTIIRTAVSLKIMHQKLNRSSKNNEFKKIIHAVIRDINYKKITPSDFKRLVYLLLPQSLCNLILSFNNKFISIKNIN